MPHKKGGELIFESCDIFLKIHQSQTQIVDVHLHIVHDSHVKYPLTQQKQMVPAILC